MHIKNPLVLDKIQVSMNLLYDLIEEIDKYQDKSLFFQDPRVIEGWLLLAGDIKEIEIEDAPESDEKWELRSEPFAAILLARRDLFSNYKKLYHLYYDPLYNLWMDYSGMDWDCVSADAKEALKANQYLQGQKDVEDLNEYIEQLNSRSNDARHALYKTLTGIFDILQAIMNKAGQVVIDLKPSDEDFVKAINDDIKGMTHSYGKSLFRDMKEDIHRHFNQRLTDNNRYELWNELLRADEKSLLMASKQQLATCEDEMQEHWGEDRKAQMDENGKLMQLIYSSCYTEELFDLSNAETVQKYVELLTADNLSMFYEIIVRRNIIQCEMYSELKVQHDEWLNPTKGGETDNHDTPQAQTENEEGVENKEPTEEERFHFIHVEIDDEEAWHIHRAIKRLVANYRVPEICNYLKEQKQRGKLMLPLNPSGLYNELVRLGMPKGEGFTEKNFSNLYNKSCLE